MCYVECVETLVDSKGQPLALIVYSKAKSEKISFLTGSDNSLQIGLMTRNESSPVAPHYHNEQIRTIKDTQEVLLVRSGQMELTVSEISGQSKFKKTLRAGDLVLLISGVHQIEFKGKTELIEIKQGPFIPDFDKTYLDEP